MFKNKIQSIGTDNISLTFLREEKISLPSYTEVRYSDGISRSLPVLWDKYSITEKGTYEISGEIQTSEYPNPFIEKRADPYIFYGPDGLYYFTASYPAYLNAESGYDRIVLRVSDTVKGLAEAQEHTIWRAHDKGEMSRHIWAPEIHYIEGKWYIFFAAGEKENVWNIRPFVLMCEDESPITGKWTECGRLQGIDGDELSFKDFSLDMTYFESDGAHYLIWAQCAPDSSLLMANVDPKKPWTLNSKPIILTKPEYDWEKIKHKVNEGASVLKIKDKIYVFFSASGTGSEYCMGVVYADATSDLMCPSSWTKVPHPVLRTEDLSGENGPGHNSFVTDEKGNLLLVYHARPHTHITGDCGCYCEESLYDPCRHARIRRVFLKDGAIPLINLSQEEIISSELKKIKAVVTII